MRILFDQGAPRGLAAALRGHQVTEARKRGWERISNGELLRLAENAGFDLLLTTDKRMRYQQNLFRPDNRDHCPWKLTLAACPAVS